MEDSGFGEIGAKACNNRSYDRLCLRQRAAIGPAAIQPAAASTTKNPREIPGI
jgi:hypothetical protein